MRLNEERGAALIIVLFISAIMMSLSSIFMLKTAHQSRMVRKERANSKAFYLAEAGGQEALRQIDHLVNDVMSDTVRDMTAFQVISLTSTYQGTNGSLQFMNANMEEAGSSLLNLAGDSSQAAFSLNNQSLGSSGGDYDYEIIFTEKAPLTLVSSNLWVFETAYEVRSKGTVDSAEQEVIQQGDFSVNIQRENFAKYALFTNSQTTPSGSRVWFTNSTSFDGPVHTNGRCNFAFNPGAEFEQNVSQTEQRARYYNNGWTALIDSDHNGTRDVPSFNDGFDRGEDAITLSSDTDRDDLKDQATGGTTYSTNGVYVPNDGTDLTGGIYVRGDSEMTMSVDGSNNAVYAIDQGGTIKTIIVDYANNQTIVDGTTYSGLPEGTDGLGTIIYADGEVSSLSGTVQENTEITISSKDDIIITDDIKYSNYDVDADGNPTADGYNNILGLVYWDGDVRISTAAPNDISVHGTILARSGIFTVDQYNNSAYGPRGTATLLGGVISDNYGAFGTFSGSTGANISGYGRNFVYDHRMENGAAPPYFPSLEVFITRTEDITDRIVWQEGGF